MASLNLLKRKTQKKKKRVGRGQGSKRGKTSGRGTKGQNARAGRKKRPEIRDFIKKLPKRRGYGKNRARGTIGGKVLPVVVTLSQIDKAFSGGEVVSPTALAEKKVIPVRGGKLPKVKIVATGEIGKKVSIEKCAVSAGARKAIESAGGSVA